MSAFDSVLQGAGLVMLAALVILVGVLARKLAHLAREVRLSREDQVEDRVRASLEAAGFSEDEAREAAGDTRE